MNKSYINVLPSLLLDSEKIEFIEYFVDFFNSAQTQKRRMFSDPEPVKAAGAGDH